MLASRNIIIKWVIVLVLGCVGWFMSFSCIIAWACHYNLILSYLVDGRTDSASLLTFRGALHHAMMYSCVVKVSSHCFLIVSTNEVIKWRLLGGEKKMTKKYWSVFQSFGYEFNLMNLTDSSLLLLRTLIRFAFFLLSFCNVTIPFIINSLHFWCLFHEF